MPSAEAFTAVASHPITVALVAIPGDRYCREVARAPCARVLPAHLIDDQHGRAPPAPRGVGPRSGAQHRVAPAIAAPDARKRVERGAAQRRGGQAGRGSDERGGGRQRAHDVPQQQRLAGACGQATRPIFAVGAAPVVLEPRREFAAARPTRAAVELYGSGATPCWGAAQCGTGLHAARGHSPFTQHVQPQFAVEQYLVAATHAAARMRRGTEQAPARQCCRACSMAAARSRLTQPACPPGARQLGVHTGTAGEEDAAAGEHQVQHALLLGRQRRQLLLPPTPEDLPVTCNNQCPSCNAPRATEVGPSQACWKSRVMHVLHSAAYSGSELRLRVTRKPSGLCPGRKCAAGTARMGGGGRRRAPAAARRASWRTRRRCRPSRRCRQSPRGPSRSPRAGRRRSGSPPCASGRAPPAGHGGAARDGWAGRLAGVRRAHARHWYAAACRDERGKACTLVGEHAWPGL